MDIWMLVALLLITEFAPATAGPEPLSVQWNTNEHFGPDGPWQGVELAIGTPPQTVTLYPGSIYGSIVFSSAFCNSSNHSVCPALDAGVFNVDASTTVDDTTIAYAGPGDNLGAADALNQSVDSYNLLDTQQIYSTLDHTSHSIKNAVFSAIVHVNESVTNNTFYNPRVGFLSLGGPSPNQTFAGNPNVNGSLIPGYLSSAGVTPSSSLGLHIGSVPMGQVGSLIYGGYDQSRLLGTVASYSVSSNLAAIMPLPLVDVELGVEKGGSPFDPDHSTGLLQKSGNSTVPTALTPAYPYINLPFGTCEAIANYLPVTYIEGPGLYVWNTDDPLYSTIINSPAYMGFVFQQTAGRGNITIKVPFSLLNLTLESPLVASSQPYWPCRPSEYLEDGGWLLGRAFLQGAYVSLNWDSQTFFIAQAAGPGSAPSLVQSMDSSSRPPSSSQQSLYDTWSSKWTVLPSNSSTSADGGPKPSSTAAPAPSPSKAAIAGIAVGISIAVTVVLIAVILLWRRRQARVAQNKGRFISLPLSISSVSNEQLVEDFHSASGSHGQAQLFRYELDRSEVRHVPAELPSR